MLHVLILAALLQAPWLPDWTCQNDWTRWLVKGHCDWLAEQEDIFAKIEKERHRSPDAPPHLVRLRTYYAEQPGSQGENEGRVAAVLFASGDRGVLVIHGQYDTAETKICATRTPRCLRIRDALSDAKIFYARPIRATQITIIGHADIQSMDSDRLGVSEQVRAVCAEKKLDPNECVALARAIDVQIEIETIFADPTKLRLRIDFDPDPFMRTTNARLGGALYRELNLEARVDSLLRRLEIDPQWDAKRAM